MPIVSPTRSSWRSNCVCRLREHIGEHTGITRIGWQSGECHRRLIEQQMPFGLGSHQQPSRPRERGHRSRWHALSCIRAFRAWIPYGTSERCRYSMLAARTIKQNQTMSGEAEQSQGHATMRARLLRPGRGEQPVQAVGPTDLASLWSIALMAASVGLSKFDSSWPNDAKARFKEALTSEESRLSSRA